MRLTDEEIMDFITEEFGDDLITCTKEEMKESIKKYIASYQPLQYEIDKPASEYNKKELELLKQSFIKSTTEKRLELEYRHNILYSDGKELIDILYKAMTKEERNKMLRIKHMENQPAFEVIED